jgi:hypothetical protein
VSGILLVIVDMAKGRQLMIGRVALAASRMRLNTIAAPVDPVRMPFSRIWNTDLCRSWMPIQSHCLAIIRREHFA